MTVLFKETVNEKEKKPTKERRFSLENDFMNYSIDDLLLGYLQYLATFDVAKKRLYLWKKIYLKNRKTIGKCLSMTT